jgi:hypothetical protein
LLENGTQLANGKAPSAACSASRAARASPSGSQATASSDQGSSAFSTLTAACLSSGCLDVGQNAGVVSALTPASRSPVLEHAAQVFGAPVHGHEGLAHAPPRAGLHGHHDGAAPAGHVHQVAFGQQAARHVLRVHLHAGLGHMAEQAAQRAGAAHAVPLVAQAPGGQLNG